MTCRNVNQLVNLPAWRRIPSATTPRDSARAPSSASASKLLSAAGQAGEVLCCGAAEQIVKVEVVTPELAAIVAGADLDDTGSAGGTDAG